MSLYHLLSLTDLLSWGLPKKGVDCVAFKLPCRFVNPNRLTPSLVCKCPARVRARNSLWHTAGGEEERGRGGGGLGGSWVLISAELLPKMPCRELSFILLVDFGKFELFDNWEKAARSTAKCCYQDTRVRTSWFLSLCISFSWYDSKKQVGAFLLFYLASRASLK